MEGASSRGLQSITVLSLLPVASSFPLGLNATHQTSLPCPRRTASDESVSVRQRRMVWSELVVARVAPSGEKAADQTASSWPWSCTGTGGTLPPAPSRSPSAAAMEEELRSHTKASLLQPVATSKSLTGEKTTDHAGPGVARRSTSFK